MKETVLFVVLDLFADFEYPFLATTLNNGIEDQDSRFQVKTVSTSVKPIKSLGGFTVIPDYSVENAPKDYAALVLIGGVSWRTQDAKKVLPLVTDAIERNILLAAICDATVFLGMNGLLNNHKHTSNTLESLETASLDNYTNRSNYQNEQAVVDGRLITANGTGFLEFTRQVLTALEAFTPDYIETYYQINKLGFIDFLKQ